ncbi:MAG: GntR family transcriptional regulator [Pseudotabrizicola sp.]|uniref:GntR family transcriptional regulator n=1 Tax=Pseudotabrizicola sp. TaxID=2939647 RepID=UPI00272927B0|nr:GntR family transcriptional regulator [Pseudotabrizicola sp.]MDO8883717.1 GntR family transcriptional regulator [Pseudotabrizicola sp.]MDP2081284.1 GntR family transcriptional regulator [Pseudotabrizicola sp.]MDZ7576097.1 GntR family transcriptional regulator [Pseudotabrizicola sp.]
MSEPIVTHQKALHREAHQTAGEPSLRQIAYDRIEELLNWGRVRPGQIISQRELMDMTGVTLGSVREAVPRFEAEGLLQTLPQRGLMVPSLDVSFIREAYQMRRLIELGAVPDILARLDRATITEWIDWHLVTQAQLGRDDESDLAEVLRDFQLYDWDMHAQMVNTMENRLISNVYRVTAIKIRMVAQSRVRVTRQNATRVIKEHLGFLIPMLNGESENAVQALSHHIDQSLTLALGGVLQG